MERSAAAAGGSTYYADLVVDALREIGLRARRPGQAGLDFGCSSGRVVRVLAAAYPEIDVARLRPASRTRSSGHARTCPGSLRAEPRAPAACRTRDDAFDFVFAISIWIHFAEGAALNWLREMQRIIRPGGRLVLTTHGAQSIVHTSARGRALARAARARCATRSVEDGFWYAAEFGEQGDHGVANPEWGTAFLSPEWLLAKLEPRLARLRSSGPGRVEDNQDLYVLERELGGGLRSPS